MAERTKATDLMTKRVVDALSEQERLAFLSFVRLFAAVDMCTFGTEGYGERPSVTGRYIDPATRATIAARLASRSVHVQMAKETKGERT
jgi:hypothetical protein